MSSVFSYSLGEYMYRTSHARVEERVGPSKGDDTQMSTFEEILPKFEISSQVETGS